MPNIHIKTLPALAALLLAFAAGWGLAEWRHSDERARLHKDITEYQALVEATQTMAQKSLDHSVDTQAALTTCALQLRSLRPIQTTNTKKGKR